MIIGTLPKWLDSSKPRRGDMMIEKKMAIPPILANPAGVT